MLYECVVYLIAFQCDDRQCFLIYHLFSKIVDRFLQKLQKTACVSAVHLCVVKLEGEGERCLPEFPAEGHGFRSFLLFVASDADSPD